MSGPQWVQQGYLASSGAELEDTEIAISVLGRFRSRGGFDHLNPNRDSCVLHFVHGGQGVLECEGRRFEVGAGDTFCFFPGERYRYFDLPGKPWRYSWARLSGRRTVELLSRLGFEQGQWVQRNLRCDAALGLLDEIEAVFLSDHHSQFYPQAAAWRLLDRLSPEAEPTDRGARLATICRRILDERFRQPLHLGQLARELGVDRSTLFRRFQSVHGCAPKEYLDRLRLEHARALLADGMLTVSEVAFRCGYTSLARFSQAFKARYGRAPSRFMGQADPVERTRT